MKPTSTISRILFVAGLVLVCNSLMFNAFGQTLKLLSVSNDLNWYEPGRYEYGPAIIMNSNMNIDMWVAEQGGTIAWDNIGYRHSTDGGLTWTAPVAALKPDPGTKDSLSCCDPGVIKIGNYYYIGYTSTQNPKGIQNSVFIARSTNPSSGFQKWNGNGWGGAPEPIAAYTKDTVYWGYGEPSMVLKDSVLYFYYSDVEDVEYTNLFTCNTILTDDNWPLSMVDHGRVATHHINAAEDSWDVKYIDGMNKFIAISGHNRFTDSATIAVWQSDDGITNWQPAMFMGIPVYTGCHNTGISGLSNGHIDLTLTNFIAYSSWPKGTAWSYWPSYLNYVNLTLSDSIYNLTSSAGAHGTIYPLGTIPVVKGGSQPFVFTPDAGYVIANVMVDSVSKGTPGFLALTKVADNHTINVTFKKKTNSVIDVSYENEINIYPTPTDNVLFIESKNINLNNATLKLFNSLGSLVLQKQCKGFDKEELDLTGLSKGVYYISISYPDINNKSYSKAVLLQ